MRGQLKDGMIILSAEDAEEREQLARFASTRSGHVYLLYSSTDKGCSLQDLGPREMACQEPINVTFWVEERWRPISNLAPTPFELRGRPYASIEGFWQGLKFDDPAERERIAALHGNEAKLAARDLPEPRVVFYEGAEIPVGRPEHWALMRQACMAKFTQNQTAREALLSTGDRPLIHRVRRDSRTIPGVVMADIWMRVRAKVKAGA